LQRFRDFAQEDRPLDGEKRRIDDILNQEIVVLDARISESKYAKEGDGRKRVATIQFEIDSETYVAFTGSGVLIKQIETYRDQIPFITTIRKIDRYYTFS
jgi:hypothetical protein